MGITVDSYIMGNAGVASSTVSPQPSVADLETLGQPGTAQLSCHAREPERPKHPKGASEAGHALLLDCDGVIADSDPLTCFAFRLFGCSMLACAKL